MFEKYARAFVIISLIAFITCPVAIAKSPDFPKKPIRFLVPYPAGSGNDIQTRGLAPYLEKYVGGAITIDNRPGADGRLGLNEAWKSAPDGYTIINAGMPTPIINEKLFPGSVTYRTKEFTHIYAWSQDNVGLFVNAEKWKTAKEFLAEARTRSMVGGISGIGSVSHIAGLSLAGATTMKPVNWVPFKGGAETVTSLAGKHIDFGVTTTSSAKPLVDAGKLRIIMVFSEEKDPVFSNAPLPHEAIGLNLESLPIVRGALAPPGMATQIAADLRDAFAKAAKDPDFLAWAKKVRVEIQPMDHEKFLKYTVGVEKEVMKYLDKIQAKGN
ncbi:MAG: tripartite tricarboxylate transporter substrate binding protein [Deltaproteobacteria bacterium]|nr:tripartite tricarboxylate transporter substrate binding protein [Deltaproteobacteria bacterium]